MYDYIDIYCERTVQGLFSEPLNAVTNLSFFVAAFFAYRLAKKENALTLQSTILIVLLVAIGTGSSLFHTFANTITELSDVLPILFFQILFIWFYSLKVIKLNFLKTSGLFAIFIVLTVLSGMAPKEILNGSLGYAPAILFLFGFGLWHLKVKRREPFILLIASMVFLLSLSLRSMDMAVCESMPIGTHYWWHILNGFVLYCTTRGYILNVSKYTQNSNNML
ncbi:MAG: hypothetical protein GC137_06960 [Alphaproteobacteria bacterium]|nr:hypothetical protein [Alphaproteobacteria bacterium]